MEEGKEEGAGGEGGGYWNLAHYQLSKSYYLRIILELQLLEKGKVLIDHFDKYIVSHGGGGASC